MTRCAELGFCHSLTPPCEGCTWSREYMTTCEAKELPAMPLKQRQDELLAREKIRGNVEALKAAMRRIHGGGRA